MRQGQEKSYGRTCYKSIVGIKMGNAVRVGEMQPSRKCFETCGLQNIPFSGHYYTWSNKQMAQDRVYSKLDRVMANGEWMDKFETTNAIFITEGCSDHCLL
ncbi:Zinc finger ZZ-type and EF-hand domain-containing protein 1 [Bienertia sinuspersici]